MVLLLLAGSSLRLLAQDGDLGGGGGGGGGGDDDDWYIITYCSNPDIYPPSIFADRKLSNVTVRCFADIPPLPNVWAVDRCDGTCTVYFAETTNGPCPTIFERTWWSSDTKGNKKTRSETITVDASPPRIEIASEIKLEAEKCGTAILPSYTDAVIKDCDIISYSQDPPPGGKYPLRARIPVTLRAKNECHEVEKTFTVIVVCEGCSDCSAGKGDPEDTSIHLDLNLGKVAEGRSAGQLTLYAIRPDKRVFSPEALRYYRAGMGAETIRDGNGWLRQIRSADVLVDIVTNNGFAFSYDIRMYASSNCIGPSEDGLYVPSGPTMLTWQVSAPYTLPAGDGSRIANSNRVSLVRKKGYDLVRYDYEYVNTAAQQGWSLLSGRKFDNIRGNWYWDGGAKRETRYSAWDDEQTVRTETYVVEGAAGRAAFREIKEYQQFPWGEAWTKSIRGDGDSALTTERGYYEDPQEPRRYARLAWERQSDGNFTWYDYDDAGRVVMEARAWKDADLPVLESNALMSAAAVTLFDYAPVDPADDGTVQPWNPRTTTELAAGQIISKTHASYVADAAGEVVEIKEECAAPEAAYGAIGNRRTRTTYYSDTAELWPSQVKSVEYPDGRMDRYVMEHGDYMDGGNEPGTFVVGAGNYIRTTEIHGTVLHPEGTGKTTREVSVRRILGKELLRETYIFGGVGYHRVDWTVKNYDDQGHLISEHFANGLARYSQWSTCCGKEYDIDSDGIRTFYEYDSLGRLEVRTKLGIPKVSSAVEPGYPEQPDIVETYVYDGAGNMVGITRNATLIRTTPSFPDGVVTQEIVKAETYSHGGFDLAGRQVESWDVSGLLTRREYAEGGRIATVIRPGGATEITENYPDGRIKSVTGTGVVPRYYDYGVDPDGSQWTMVYTGRPDSPMWQKTTTDMLGRTVKEERPGFGGVLLTITCDYNDKSQLVAVRQWEGNPPVAQVGVTTLYEYDELGDQVRMIQDVNGNGVVDMAGPDRISETQSRIATISGERWRETISKVYPVAGSANSVASSIQRRPMVGEDSGYSALTSESVDERGNVTRTSVAVDPARRIVTTTIDSPDSTVDAVTVVRNGLVHSARPSIWRDPTYFANDGLGRQVMVTDPRTGNSSTEYNDRNQIVKTWGASGQAEYEYDDETGLRTTVVKLGKAIHTAYDLQGRPTNIWGATYPVAYEYDDYGRMSAMKTWRDTNSEPDVTRWFYDEATGLLTNKVYADGNGTSYEYDAAGRLTRRIWARGVATDYAYDSLGQMTNINYSDGTPDVSFTYDRMGRQVGVTDVLGTRSNVFHPYRFDLLAEYLPDGQCLTRFSDAFGRPVGFAVGTNGYRIAYAYDDVGRFAAITSEVNGATSAVKYAYLAQSDLIFRWTAKNTAGTTLLEVKRLYEPRRDLVATVSVSCATGTLAQYDYRSDGFGRRIARGDRVDGMVVSNAFGYNAQSELDVAVMGTNQFGYQYDAIGNRQVAVANDQSVQYDANALNQYASILPSAGTPAYDADGNMTSDGTHSYIWDAENRLVEIRPIATSAGSKMVQYLYDYLGRRVGKRVFAWGTFGGNDGWYWSDGRYFVYDGWNLIGEYEPPARPATLVPYASATNMFLLGVGGATNASYVWGLDLSGSLQGAGGVGGLICQIRDEDGSGRPLFSFCDANGNVTGLAETNGAVVARYDYDPYGNLMAMSGDQAEANPFRFSSKHWEEETGFYYYGYRFYSPEMGRWINRDPIEEEGGINLFSLCANNPINCVDSYGLFSGSDVLSENKSITINIGGNPDLQWVHIDKYVKRYSIYRGAPWGESFGSFNGWSVGPRNDRVFEKVNSCCAKVRRNVSFLVETETSIIDRQYIGESGSVTARGWDAVHAHEYRRVKSVLLGATAYLAPIAGTGYAALKCGVVCDDKGVDVAIDKLNKYLASLQAPAERQVEDYYWSQKGKIDNEKWVMKGNLHDYHVNIRNFDPPPPYKPIECPK